MWEERNDQDEYLTPFVSCSAARKWDVLVRVLVLVKRHIVEGMNDTMLGSFP